jgi:predicted amidohydrolase YtcJ
VVPGFIDSHIHFLMGGERMNSVSLKHASTKEEFIHKIGEHALKLEGGEWITGGDWDHMNWGGELPTRFDIDAVT